MSSGASGNLVVLCDFDGTIVELDTGEFVLRRFTSGGWMELNDQLARHEITLEECIKGQFSLVKTTEPMILEEVEKVASFRPNFGNLVDCCISNGLRLIVASAGLDFCIRRLLDRGGWLEYLEIQAPRAECTPSGIRLTFPRLNCPESENFKDDLVRSFKAQGKRVIYIGDGLADLQAVKNADFPFAIQGSRLARLCRDEGIPHQELADFAEVISAIKQNN
jgi:2,3-diketo-5-methylthio-1-phosphopentane phosphatase